MAPIWMFAVFMLLMAGYCAACLVASDPPVRSWRGAFMAVAMVACVTYAGITVWTILSAP